MAIEFDDAKNLTLSAELWQDKIIYRKSVTYTIPLASSIGDYVEFSFPHSLSPAPLLIGSYSDDDFETSYDFGIGPYGTLTTYGYDGYTLLAHVWSTSTHVFIRAQAHNTARTVTFHILGLAQRTSTPASVDTPPTQDNLLLTTDNNALKHHTLAVVPLTTNGLGTYAHTAYSTPVSTPLTMMMFIAEDGKISYMNTMNTITNSGTTFIACTKPNYLRVSVLNTVVKTVNVLIKTYVDA